MAAAVAALALPLGARASVLDEPLAAGLAGVAPEAEAVEGELLVRFRSSAPAAKRAAVRRAAGVSLERVLSLRRIEVVRVPPGRDERQAARRLESDPAVAYAEPNLVYRIAGVPDDARFSEQWALHNAGDTIHGQPGTADADIDAPEAWDISAGSPAVTVAVVDTGVVPHADLEPNLVPGYDFVWDDPDPLDRNGHGTHVAGVIAARSGDGAGIAGVAPRTKIMPLQAFDGGGSGHLDDILEAFAHARDHGVDVVNASFSSGSTSEAMAEAIHVAKDVLFVFPAGNGGQDVDDGSSWTWPCTHSHENLLCVAATDGRDQLPRWSGRGSVSVDLAAPGSAVLSSHPELTVVRSDDFETEPSARWATDASAPWTWTARWAHGGSRSLGSSATPGYDANWAEYRPAVDLTGYRHCRADVWTRFSTPLPFDDALYLDYLADWGWEDLGATSGPYEGPMTILLAEAEADPAALRIRFRLDTHRLDSEPEPHATAEIDDFAIRCLPQDPNPTGFEYLSGTSMATAHVAGAAALRLTVDPGAGPLRLKAALMQSVDRVPALEGKTVSGGRLNLHRALTVEPRLAQPPSPGTITTAVGNSDAPPVDGGDAAGSYVWEPSGVSTMRDGGYLIVSRVWNRVYRVDPQGRIHHIAGATGDGKFSGDGGPATEAELNRPEDVVEAADGSILIADWGNSRVRRVDREGTITTIAGGGAQQPPGDGSLATGVDLEAVYSVSPTADGGFLLSDGRIWRVSPAGRISRVHGVDGREVEALPDGGLLATRFPHSVDRVWPDGSVTHVAGTGGEQEGFSGEGGPATAARLYEPQGLAATPDGGFLIADVFNHRIRRVYPDGTIWTVAGAAAWGWSGDGGPATDALLEYPSDIAILPGGGFLIADSANNRIRRVSGPPWPPAPPPPTEEPPVEEPPVGQPAPGEPPEGQPPAASAPGDDGDGESQPSPPATSPPPVSGPGLEDPAPPARPRGGRAWARVTGRQTARGFRVRALGLRLPAGSSATLRCVGDGCPRARWRVNAADRTRTVRFARLEKVLLRRGTALTVLVTRPGARRMRFVFVVTRRGELAACRPAGRRCRP